MYKNTSTIWRFLIPIIILLLAATILLFQYLSSQQLRIANTGAKLQAISLVNLLKVTDKLIKQDIDIEMTALKNRSADLGIARINGEMSINQETVPKLIFGSQNLTRDFLTKNALDSKSDLPAAIYVKKESRFIKLIDNSSRKTSMLAYENVLSAQHAATLALNAHHSYFYVQDFFGHPYITRYDPITNSQGVIIGAISVGHEIDTSLLIDAIDQSKVLKNSATIVLSHAQKIQFFSKNIDLQQALKLIQPSKDWVLIKVPLTTWGYQVVIAYELNDARALGINNVIFIIVGSILLSIALISILLLQMQRLILRPIGADPLAAIKIVQKIALGDLNKDDMQAEPDTLMANVITMRSKLNEYIQKLKDNSEQLALAASVFNHAHDGIFITNAHLQIIDVNAAFSKITGYDRHAVIHNTPKALGFAFHDAHFFDDLITDLDHIKWRGEVWNLRNDGDVYAAWLDLFTIYDNSNQVSHFVGLFSDISEVKVQQKNLEHMAYHDPLTQLPNRALFSEKLKKSLLSTDPTRELLAICYLDLDGFKPVNDNLGHEAGDALLVMLASRIRNCLRHNDTVARLGGDEFAVLLSELKNTNECTQTLDRLLDAIKAPYEVANEWVKISASIGYTIYPLDLSEPDTLLRHADHAMYHVKVNGRGFHHMFDAEQDRKSRTLFQEREAIQAALPNNEFILFYQPKVNMRTGEVVGMEALIRWQHPERGMRSPAEFLPIIEQDIQFTVQIGEWVICETLRQICVWQKSGLSLKISVNISPNHMMQSDFAPRLKVLLDAQPDVSPTLLELEITETAAIEDIAGVANSITECKKFGISFALDDFGVGYSSLTYLRRLPVAVIKIDQSFVRDMLQDHDDLAVVSGVINLGQSFGLDVVAEGVETDAHGVQLLKMGCFIAQGYGIAKPIEGNKVLQWVHDYQAFESWINFKA